MKDLVQLERLRALSREKQSLLVMWLRAERGATVQLTVQSTVQLIDRGAAAALPRELDAAAIQVPANLPSPEDVEKLSNEEVDSLLRAMLASESPAGLALPGSAAARSATSAPMVPDTDSMSDDEVTAMLAELLQQEETR